MAVTRDPVTHDGQRVNAEGQGEVVASKIEEISWFSRNKRTAYVVSGQTDTLTASKNPVIYLKNTSPDKDLIVFRASFQTIAEAATIPAVGIYWSLDLNATCTGGSSVTPLNLNTGASKASQTTALTSTPTISVAGNEVGRVYAGQDGAILSPTIGQSIIVAPNGSYTLSYTTTGTAGIANAFILFYMRSVVE